MAKALSLNSSLERLYLGMKINKTFPWIILLNTIKGNKIGDSGASSLSEALKRNSSLTILDLRGDL